MFENLYIINTLVFLDMLDTDTFFKVIWVPPEVKDKAVEPMTSVHEQTGRQVGIEAFRDAFTTEFRLQFDANIVPGSLNIIEHFWYKKTRTKVCRK